MHSGNQKSESVIMPCFIGSCESHGDKITPFKWAKLASRKGNYEGEQFLLKLAGANLTNKIMSEAIIDQITRLEMHYAEQEHTLQALNDVVARQDQELSRITNELKLLTQQYQTLKSHLPEQFDPAEKPPHY